MPSRFRRASVRGTDAEHTVVIAGAPDPLHASNKIKTSQSTALWLDFIPLNLFKQFRRVANCYFLVICFMQTRKTISITDGKPSTILGLGFVILVTMIKDAIEEVHRMRADRIENNRVAHRRTTGRTGDCSWQQIQTGDLLLVRNREFIPADLVLLGTSNEHGQCHVMTANLDGETNLKLRQMAPGLLAQQPPLLPDANRQGAPEISDCVDVPGTVLCDTPNKHLGRFDGTFVAPDGSKVPLGPNNIILRGTVLRNTAWALGVVIYTGKQTKIQQNAARAPFKMSRLSKMVDKTLFLVFLSMIAFCAVACFVGRNWWSSSSGFFSRFPGGIARSADWDAFLRFFTYILVFTNYIPISLLVTQELCKFAQAFFMNWDRSMYHASTDTPARVRCSDLNEELGMVDHIFTDKTGTLTCNVMAFRKCSIGAKAYGEAPQDGSVPYADEHVHFH